MFILYTALKDIRRRLRDPIAFAIWLGIPLALGGAISLAFGGLSSGKAPTAEIWVVNNDDSALSGFLVTALGAGSNFGLPIVAREVSSAEGRSRIENGEGSALLVIPAGFGDDLLNERPTSLELVTNPTQSVLPQMVEESLRLVVDAVFYLQQTLGEPISRMVDAADSTNGFPDNSEVAEISILMNDAMRRMGALLFPPVIDLQIVRKGQTGSVEGADEGPGFIDVFLPSMLFMALFFMAFGISEDIWVEKQTGTLGRALATPHASAGFLAGKLLAATTLMALVSFATLVAARYLLAAHVQSIVVAGLWATLAGVLFLTLLYSLQLFATSQRGGELLASLIMMPLLMLGGSFFPFSVMPDGLARIGRFTPNGWALTELLEILRGEAGWGHLALSGIAVVSISILFFFVANRRMAGAFARS